MPLDFPPMPTQGQVFTSNGKEYRWDGFAWSIVDAMAAVVVSRTPTCTIAPAPPLGAFPADLWFNATNGFFYIYYDDGDTQQWVVTNPGKGGSVGPPGPQGPQGPPGADGAGAGGTFPTDIFVGSNPPATVWKGVAIEAKGGIAMYSDEVGYPYISFGKTDAALNEKLFQFYSDIDGSFRLQSLLDDWSVQREWKFTRDGDLIVGKTGTDITAAGTWLYGVGWVSTWGLQPGIDFANWSNAANEKIFQITARPSAGGSLQVEAMSDAWVQQAIWTFQRNGAFTAQGAISAPGFNAQANSAPTFTWASTGNPVDQKYWNFYQDGTGNLHLLAQNDLGGVINQFVFGRDGGFISPSFINTLSYRINNKGFAYEPIAGFLGLTNLGDGAVNIYLGGPADPTNYHRNGYHKFQNLAGSATWLDISSAAAVFGVGGTMPTPSGAAVSTEIVTAQWVVNKGYVTGGPYQTTAGMSSYLTTAAAGTTYQTIAGMSSYLTTAAAGTTYATLASPVFSGNPTAPTPAIGDSDTSVATTNYVQLEIATLAQTIQNGAYSTVLGDAGGSVYHPVAQAAANWTIPANATVAYQLGTTITFVNDSVNAITIICGDTMVLSPAGTTGNRTLAQFGMATAYKATATRWLISGTGLT